ncbi:MAG: TldD/PmbA family protein [Candidatus Tectimicrobiota bacterium]
MELYELQDRIEFALERLDETRAVLEAEVCASWCEQQVVRIAYDAEHPAEAIQAVRTVTTYGLSLLAVFAEGSERRVGFGVTAEDISREGILEALDMAKQNAQPEAYYGPLPVPAVAPAVAEPLYDPQVLTLAEEELTQAAIEALDGALSTFKDAGYVRQLRLQGQVCSRAEHLALGNTHGLLAAETTTGARATLQSALQGAPGAALGARAVVHWRDLNAYEAGVEAAQHALQQQQSVTVAPGDYAVIFGPWAVAELLENLLLPALSLDTVAAGTSPLAGRLGEAITSPLLSLTDEGRLPGLLGSRLMTGEGLPTGTTPLIEHGRLVGFLADVYHAHKLAPQLGPLVPRNGLRHALNGQSFSMRPGIFPTNVLLNSSAPCSPEALLETLDSGLYIGRLWNTVTPAGLQTGQCSSLVLGPSFRIRQGKLGEPITPGTLRLQDNILDLLQRCSGLSSRTQAVALGTGQSLILAPELACTQAHFLAAV